MSDTQRTLLHSMKSPKQLWIELGDIPIDDNENIEEPFLHFPIGTFRWDIWHWFEEEFNLSIHDLMFPKPGG